MLMAIEPQSIQALAYRANLHEALFERCERDEDRMQTIPAAKESNLQLAIRDFGRAIHLFPSRFSLYLGRARVFMRSKSVPIFH
jgi:hypothetical protein